MSIFINRLKKGARLHISQKRHFLYPFDNSSRSFVLAVVSAIRGHARVAPDGPISKRKPISPDFIPL
jgi:hypothetical protein